MPEKQRRIMYRTERLGVKLTIQISAEVHDAITAEAKKVSMSQSVFARLLLDEGLKSWWAQRAPKPRRSGGG